MNKRFDDSYYLGKEAKLSMRAKAELLNQRVKHEVSFPVVPGLNCFTDPSIRKEIDLTLGTGEFDGTND